MDNIFRFTPVWQFRAILFTGSFVISFLVMTAINSLLFATQHSFAMSLIVAAMGGISILPTIPKSVVLNDQAFSVEHYLFSADTFPYSRLRYPSVRHNVRLIRLLGGDGDVLTFDFYNGVVKKGIQLAPSLFQDGETLRQLLRSRVESETTTAT